MRMCACLSQTQTQMQAHIFIELKVMYAELIEHFFEDEVAVCCSVM